MSTHIKILNKTDIKVFDEPPKFDSVERNNFFRLPKWGKELVEKMKTDVNKTGFILQLCYFKATNKFFHPKKSYKDDLKFVTKKFDISLEKVNFQNFSTTIFNRNKTLILEKYGFRSFDKETRLLLKKEALFLSSTQIKLEFLFISLVEFLKRKKIEVPTYHAISEMITEALIDYEKGLSVLIENNITDKQKELLEELLEFDDEKQIEEQRHLKNKRHKLTWLKKSHESTQPYKIKENILDLEYLQSLFFHLEPLVKSLNLSPEVIKYYAYIVMTSQVFQISRRNEKSYLFLIAFIIHKFYTLQDLLIDTLLQSVKHTINNTLETQKEVFYENRETKTKIINEASEFSILSWSTFEKIKNIVNSSVLSSNEKVVAVKEVLGLVTNEKYEALPEKLYSLEKFSDRLLKNEDYYDILENKSLKLQNRASQIVKNIEFDSQNSKKPLVEAIEYYKNKDVITGSNAPCDFLDTEEDDIIFNEKGKFRVSLYKALLFDKIADSIKSGTLNLNYSYKYLSFDNYLIPKEQWESNKELILERAGLSKVSTFNTIEPYLKQNLGNLYKKVNENIFTGKNEYLKFDANGKIKLTTPKVDKEELYNTAELFSKTKFVPLFEILTAVNGATNFLDTMKHWEIKHIRKKPEVKDFIAGIIGYGCNIGIQKIADISRNINKNELTNIINWYFSIDNLNQANDKILEFTDRLEIPRLFRNSSKITHTSSDGQKYNIAVESLNANYSFKYFGKGKGVTVYSFIDESHRLFYSTVINSSEKEAAYVIDGLMYNDVVQSDIHSTDTHGYSEIIFAVSHLLGFSFAPRIKNFKKQKLYSFQKKSELKNLGYKILPDKKINTEVIEKNWDDILRFIATIKLKHTTASQLLLRLSSYSKQHPLYQALKAFGRIIKTIFLLTYIDDLKLRQSIEKQLNKLENANKFAKAVFHGNNQEFQQETKEEQIIAETCKRLIENSIICWNYLYLSQRILEAKHEKQKQHIINIIKNGSVVVWQHINLQGEYDFSEKALKKSIKFNIPDILKVKINT